MPRHPSSAPDDLVAPTPERTRAPRRARGSQHAPGGRPTPVDEPPRSGEPTPDGHPAPGADAGSDAATTTAPAAPSLAGLGIAGVSRRRVAWVGLVALAAWIVIAFAGQAAAAAQGSADVAEALARNAAASAETEALRRELELVTQERWILQQARAYQLGSRQERPFALAPGAPTLPPDAPGSQARRLGAVAQETTPLEAWLDVLFGPAPDR
jgi:hypothetical protein